MNIARARTDEKGHRLVGQYPGNMRATPLFERRKDPWSIEIGKWTNGKVGDLLTDDNCAFHLLGSYLTNDIGLLANEPCKFGKTGIWRVVIVQGKEFRSDSMRVFRRKMEQGT